MKKKAIDYKDILSMFLPKACLTILILPTILIWGGYYIFSLEEKNSIPDEYSSLSLVSKGFYPEIIVTDFPVRDRTVYLKVKRRRWEDKQKVRHTAEIGNWLQTGLG